MGFGRACRRCGCGWKEEEEEGRREKVGYERVHTYGVERQKVEDNLKGKQIGTNNGGSDVCDKGRVWMVTWNRNT